DIADLEGGAGVVGPTRDHVPAESAVEGGTGDDTARDRRLENVDTLSATVGEVEKTGADRHAPEVGVADLPCVELVADAAPAGRGAELEGGGAIEDSPAEGTLERPRRRVSADPLVQVDHIDHARRLVHGDAGRRVEVARSVVTPAEEAVRAIGADLELGG